MLLDSDSGRIVTVSSVAHRNRKIDFDDLTWDQRGYKAGRAYGDSKIANLYFTSELARMLKDTQITVAAAHPGWTSTNLQKHSKFWSALNHVFSQKPPRGALPTLRAATDESVNIDDYYGPGGFLEIKGYPIEVNSNSLSKNKQIAKQLWDVSVKLTGIKFSLK